MKNDTQRHAWEYKSVFKVSKAKGKKIESCRRIINRTGCQEWERMKCERLESHNLRMCITGMQKCKLQSIYIKYIKVLESIIILAESR